MNQKPPDLIYGLDDRPSLPVLAVLGLQHVFIISISLIFPIVIVRAMGGSDEMAGFMVSMTMLAAGIATVIQALGRRGVGSGYLCPSVAGPSYLSASILAAQTGGLHLVFGMTALAGMFEGLFSRILPKLRFLFPAEVTGVVVMMVGVAVIPLAVPLFFGWEGDVGNPAALAVALITLATMVGMNVWGRGSLKLYSVLIGMIVGYIAAYALGLIGSAEIGLVMARPLFEAPDLSYFGWAFDPVLIVPFFVAIICSSLKSVGDLTSCQKINDPEWKRPDMTNISGGILADGAGAVVAGIVGGMGQSTSSSNIGLSIATSAASRVIAFSIGAILVALAFFPKLAGVFVIMPAPVMGAALIFAVSFMIITGLSIITSRMLDARKTFVVGISLIFGLSVDIFPEIYAGMHPSIQPVFSSSLSLATVCVILLNLVMRIGLRQEQEMTLEPGERYAGSVHAFMERQGAAWGAPRDVIVRATSALTECVEMLAVLGRIDRPLQVTAAYDEFNLDIQVTVPGGPVDLSSSPPTEDDLLEDESAIARLSAVMIRRFADRVSSACDGRECRISMHFDN
ncbi:uracil-xanthine permease family protein [Methanofollis fontis]|uniref:Xanthine permease n=1 Tax=Methanofollis fontis TaxID=2052832 RepID=A0A483CSP0_9EURY|nr:solute carrier family 23 protein [Methanofollis fontis]TAJ44211.1 xanthine permease [Methanofollis fontis]